jgi:pyruvate,water dikinase
MDRGVLADPSHVFQLRHSELREVLAGGTGPGPEHLAERHAQYQRCLTLDLPELVEVGNGWLRPLDEAFIRSRGLLPPAKLEADVACLRGIAAAPGVTTATARVLLEPDDDFAPGDVLVARTVDPGWAPVLACAGAVVLDIGGLLSHGAVVARELGIPCVVNVKAGTELVRPGSVIRVDGSAGEVALDAG